jgi:hypothetical protein
MEDTPPVITAASQVARIFERRRGFDTIPMFDLGTESGRFAARAETPRTAAKMLDPRVDQRPLESA